VLDSAFLRAEPTANNRTIAQSLFEQGRRLMQSGDYTGACTKFEESQKLDPGGGTLLNLGLCHEKQGKLGSAWADFKEALSSARRDGREDRAAVAQEHIAALEPRVPKLTIAVSEPVSGERVLVDGSPVGQGAWGSPMALDPGSHEIAVRAPGKKEWKASVSLQPSEEKALTVPVLEAGPSEDAPVNTPQPTAEKPAGSSHDPAAEGDGRRTIGWIVGGVGVAALATGTYFGIETLSKRKASDAECPAGDSSCSAEGVRLNDQAYTYAWVANIAIGLGIVGVGVGTYLLVTGSSASTDRPAGARSRIGVDAAVVPGAAQVQVRGTW
jgi:hypothetical protein